MDSFLNQGVGYDQEDWDDMNNQLPATNNDTFLSTPGPMYSNPPTSVVVPMALLMLDRQMKKFNGVVVRHVRRIIHCGQLVVDLVQQECHVTVAVFKRSLTCWMPDREHVCLRRSRPRQNCGSGCDSPK